MFKRVVTYTTIALQIVHFTNKNDVQVYWTGILDRCIGQVNNSHYKMTVTPHYTTTRIQMCTTYII